MHAASDTFAMFWRFGMPTTSHIDTLLEKENVTLSEVLEEDDVLQECKGQNRKLIDFLVRTDVIEELVSLITKEPSQELHETIQYKNPNMACELLTADVAAICDKLADTESAFSKLWSFLDKPAPLNPLLASFFSKTIGSLLSRRPEVVVEHIKGREDCIGLLLTHLEVSAVMDLILRLITCIESPEIRIAFLNWLNEQRFIQRLVDLIDTEQTEDKHSNAAQTLCDIVRLTREHMSQLQECAENDPLLTTVEMEETVSELLDHMFKGTLSESAIVNGISILLSLLEFRKQGPASWSLSLGPDGQEQMTQLDAERLARGVSGTLKAIVPRLADMQQLLEEPIRKTAMNTTVGKLEPPLGNVRLQISKLVSSLLITNTAAINAELARLGTIKTLLDLFFKYAWNNFLHLEVEKAITTILSNNPTESEEGKTQHPLLVHLFTEGKIIQRIVEAWDENEVIQKQGGSRRGYMGHLTRIANAVSQEMEKGCNSEQIKSLFQEYTPEEMREKWNYFVTGALSEMNKKNLVELVGTHPLHSSSEDDDADFKDIDFGKDTALQQAFSDYQMQQMTSHFIDQFGFNDEEFAEQEENVNNPFDRISDINFSISANEDNPNSALFEACCNERIQPFNDSNSDEEDIWEEKELTYTATADSRTSELSTKNDLGSDQANHSSGSEDEEDEERRENSPEDFPPLDRHHKGPDPGHSNEETKMDVDTENSWTANFDDVPMESAVAMDTTPSGWEQPASSTEEDTGWANFSDFNKGFAEDNAPGPRSSSPVDMESEPSSQEEKGSSEAETSPERDVGAADNPRGSAYVVSSSSSDMNPLTQGSRDQNDVPVGVGAETSEEKEMVVEPVAPSLEEKTICPSSQPSAPHQPSNAISDQTVDTASINSLGPDKNLAEPECATPMDCPNNEDFQNETEELPEIHNDFLSGDASSAKSVSIPLSNSNSNPHPSPNPNPHPNPNPNPSSTISVENSDSQNEKCGVINAGLNVTPESCLPNDGVNSVAELRNDVSPSQQDVTSNHSDHNESGLAEVGINIKAGLHVNLTKEVSTVPSTDIQQHSPEAAVTVSPVEGAVVSTAAEESNPVSTDQILNEKENMSPEDDEHTDNINFITKTEFMKSGASSQSPSSTRANGPLEEGDSMNDRPDSSAVGDPIQITAIAQNGPV